MMRDSRFVVQEVTGLLEPILEEMGFELVDVVFLSKQGRWVLQLFIDTEGGVTIDDCARVSGEIGDLIDVRDILEHEYVLEVSSPGIDRPLKKQKDFYRACGRKVKIRTKEPVKGRQNFTGTLQSVKGNVITLDADGMIITLTVEELEKANLVYEF